MGPTALAIGQLHGLAGGGRILQGTTTDGVTIEGGFFQANDVTFAPIVIGSGSVSINGTVFEGNAGEVSFELLLVS